MSRSRPVSHSPQLRLVPKADADNVRRVSNQQRSLQPVAASETRLDEDPVLADKLELLELVSRAFKKPAAVRELIRAAQKLVVTR
jgi:hypothetical protein